MKTDQFGHHWDEFEWKVVHSNEGGREGGGIKLTSWCTILCEINIILLVKKTCVPPAVNLPPLTLLCTVMGWDPNIFPCRKWCIMTLRLDLLTCQASKLPLTCYSHAVKYVCQLLRVRWGQVFVRSKCVWCGVISGAINVFTFIYSIVVAKIIDY